MSQDVNSAQGCGRVLALLFNPNRFPGRFPERFRVCCDMPTYMYRARLVSYSLRHVVVSLEEREGGERRGAGEL